MPRRFLLLISFLPLFALSQERALARKIADPLRAQMAGRAAGDSLSISVSLSDPVALSRWRPLLARLRLHGNGYFFTARTTVAAINSMAADTAALFVSGTATAKEELTTGAYDLTLNGITYVHARLPWLTGDSLTAFVKERSFDTADIDLKGRVIRTGLGATLVTVHASLMATMIAGAANSSPAARGVALKASVGTTDFARLFPDADSSFTRNKISVQNHSYGTAVENFYGNEAAAYDGLSNRIPTLLSVFSSGNSGTTTSTVGPYAAVSQWANLTGNFKHSKNTIAVGSIDSSGGLMPLSSKGPAHDGRVKPELMAYGEDGSSGAAATVSGAALLLQHAYRRQHATLPPSALVKAALINSADDIGHPHVDYASGYGSLNAYRAATTIEDNRYRYDSLELSIPKQYSLSVPANIAQLKLTLVWNDPAAAPNTNKALVNDLDLLLEGPGGTSWLPWVLDKSASAAALDAPAQRKTDTLNNVEQITIDNPATGNYTIRVAGTRVTGRQPFAIAWQFDTAAVFYWTFPTVNDPLTAGNTHWLRWAGNSTGTGEIEYATNGSNWRPVGTADLGAHYYKWSVPDTVTTAVLRLKRGAAVVLSDSFAISPQLRMQVGFNCADSFLLYWQALRANGYEVYSLGERYLQPLTITPDTAVIFSKAQQPSLYYAVAPLAGNKRGVRSLILPYTSGSDCYVSSFFLQSQTDMIAVFTAELGTLYRVKALELEKFSENGFVRLRSAASLTSTRFQFADSSLRQGENRYRLKVVLDNGSFYYSPVLTVYYTNPGQPVLIYPNPVRQHEKANILIDESGRYTLQVFDAAGKLLYSRMLNQTLNALPAGYFDRGLYFIRILDKKGKPLQQKLVVY